MRCMDLTHLISREMPVYPGTEPPRLQPANIRIRIFIRSDRSGHTFHR